MKHHFALPRVKNVELLFACLGQDVIGNMAGEYWRAV